MDSSPGPPFLIQPPPDGDDDDDVHPDPDRPLWNDIDDLLPASSRCDSGLLSPDAAASTFRRPSSSMSCDSVSLEGAAVPAASPFNFETQFMSASPVKSVSSPGPLPAHVLSPPH